MVTDPRAPIPARPPRLPGEPLWLRLSGRPPGGRTRAIGVIAVWLLLIGFLDYISGSRMSFVIFYLMPVVLSVLWLGRDAGLIAAAASVVIRYAADTLSGEADYGEAWLWWNSAGSLLVYLLVVWVLDSLVRLHRQLEARVRERTEDFETEVRRRQEVQRQLLELSTNERDAIGRELHDHLGQHLVGTAMAAQVLARRLATRDEGAAREARHIADLVERGIGEARQLSRGLLLTRIEPGRLGTEVEELCASLHGLHPEVACDCRVGQFPAPPSPETAAQLFRIIQEALRNACRHSGAKRVGLSLAGDAAGLTVTVEDDGRGLPPPDERRQGLGLRIMQHRAEHIGATLDITARPGGGTRVTCFLPMDSRTSAAFVADANPIKPDPPSSAS